MNELWISITFLWRLTTSCKIWLILSNPGERESSIFEFSLLNNVMRLLKQPNINSGFIFLKTKFYSDRYLSTLKIFELICKIWFMAHIYFSTKVIETICFMQFAKLKWHCQSYLIIEYLQKNLNNPQFEMN